MRLRLDQLEAVFWIARLGSFRAAAQRLNVTQPAISGRIRELERVLGIRIFDRDRQRARLTNRGHEVLKYAEQILALSHDAEQRLAQPAVLAGPIRMGVCDTFALTHLPALIARIEKQYAGVELALDVDYSVNLNRKLHRGDLDVAFLTEPTANDTVSAEPLVDLQLIWVTGRGMALPKGKLGPSELKTFPIVTNPRPSHLYATVHDWFAAHGEVPLRLSTCNSLTIMTKLAVAGFGICVLPLSILAREIERGDLSVIDTRPRVSPHHMAIAYRIDAGMPSAKAISDIAHELVSRDQGAARSPRALKLAEPA
ncbi:MAG: LysR family transcriptional regulator [Proteobacteria bacterium]|nr:LysR family transcriptional regulator [Pseudomonadota bacterium]